jgi:hypothetical protein
MPSSPNYIQSLSALSCYSRRMRLHFKRVYGPEAGEWGIVGFTEKYPSAGWARLMRNQSLPIPL